MRYILQVIGASLLLVGMILFFFSPSSEHNQALKKEVVTLKAENQKLQQKVKQLEKEAKEVKKAENETSKQTNERPKATIKTVIAIEEGSDSMTVANSLEKAKIIDNAKAFNDFLVETGYASKIKIGEYEIDEKMTFQQIAETITKKTSN